MDTETEEYGAGLEDVVQVELAHYERPDLVNLQMVLVTSSMNHEYARKAYEKSQSFEKRQELMTRMAHLKELYFSARNKLKITFPDKLVAIERELNIQKQSVLADQNIH